MIIKSKADAKAFLEHLRDNRINMFTYVSLGDNKVAIEPDGSNFLFHFYWDDEQKRYERNYYHFLERMVNVVYNDRKHINKKLRALTKGKHYRIIGGE